MFELRNTHTQWTWTCWTKIHCSEATKLWIVRTPCLYTVCHLTPIQFWGHVEAFTSYLSTLVNWSNQIPISTDILKFEPSLLDEKKKKNSKLKTASACLLACSRHHAFAIIIRLIGNSCLWIPWLSFVIRPVTTMGLHIFSMHFYLRQRFRHDGGHFTIKKKV